MSLFTSLVGKTPPAFCLNDETGSEVCLEDFKGKWILIYFYPKDMTPGCTTQACEIRDSWGEFKKHDAVVLGISADNEASHQKFKSEHDLPFPLLADTEKEVVQQYHSYGTKKMFGNEYKGILRNSVLINPDFIIEEVFEKIQPKKHAPKVLKYLEKSM